MRAGRVEGHSRGSSVKERSRIRWKDYLGVSRSCINEASFISLGAVSVSLYPLLPLLLPPQASPRPPGMRTPKHNLFTRNETPPLYSDDTPQRRDQPRPEADPDPTATPATMANLTPVSRTGEQDSEWTS